MWVNCICIPRAQQLLPPAGILKDTEGRLAGSVSSVCSSWSWDYTFKPHGECKDCLKIKPLK